MAFDNLSLLFKRGRHIAQKEGLFSFIKQGALFLLGFQYNNVYIYENTLGEFDFKPRTQNVTLKIISTLEEIDKLTAEGYDFSFYCIDVIKRKIGRGAIAFCAFVTKDLAHVTFVAIRQEAKREGDPLPFAVNFQSGEACSGFSDTNPAYRRMGIYAYVYSNIFRFLREQGRSIDRFTIEKSNIASHNALAKFDSKIVGEMRYLKLFHLIKFCKKKPIKGGG